MEACQDNLRPLVGVGVIIIKEGKILLGKRRNAHGEGSWAPCGGHLEFGETVEQCAQRELTEEMGIKALSFRLSTWTSNVINKHRHYVSLFVFVEQFEGEPKLMEPDKCEGWTWFDLDTLPSPLFPTFKTFIEKVGVEYLKQLDFCGEKR